MEFKIYVILINNVQYYFNFIFIVHICDISYLLGYSSVDNQQYAYYHKSVA